MTSSTTPRGPPPPALVRARPGSIPPLMTATATAMATMSSPSEAAAEILDKIPYQLLDPDLLLSHGCTSWVALTARHASVVHSAQLAAELNTIVMIPTDSHPVRARVESFVHARLTSTLGSARYRLSRPAPAEAVQRLRRFVGDGRLDPPNEIFLVKITPVPIGESRPMWTEVEIV